MTHISSPFDLLTRIQQQPSCTPIYIYTYSVNKLLLCASGLHRGVTRAVQKTSSLYSARLNRAINRSKPTIYISYYCELGNLIRLRMVFARALISLDAHHGVAIIRFRGLRYNATPSRVDLTRRRISIEDRD